MRPGVVRYTTAEDIDGLLTAVESLTSQRRSSARIFGLSYASWGGVGVGGNQVTRNCVAWVVQLLVSTLSATTFVESAHTISQ